MDHGPGQFSSKIIMKILAVVGSHQAEVVVRQLLSGSHQAIIRWSSGSCQAVDRQWSGIILLNCQNCQIFVIYCVA